MQGSDRPEGHGFKAFAQALPDAAKALEAAAAEVAAPPASPAETKRGEAAALAAAGDREAAIAALESALVLDPALVHARLDLAEIEMAAEHHDAARGHLAQVELKPGERDLAMRFDSLTARLAALEAVKDLPATEELSAALAANPGDHKARFDLAHALIAEGAFAEALDHLLTIVRVDRKWNEGGARKAMINVFNILAGDEGSADLVLAFRRRLATALN